MIKKIQYYITTSLDPYKNLATEKYLFDNVDDDTCILYLWQNEKTVVIGKNQNPWAECQCEQLEKDGGKLARRLSGGGAVFHDVGNLNFTFICKTTNYNLEKQLKVIQTACEFAGIKTELSGRNDLLTEGKKFSGNAFYNSKGRSYHHGTLLINANFENMQKYLTPPKAKLEAKGVKSVGARVINLSSLSPNLTCKKMCEFMLKAFCEVYESNATLFVIEDNNQIKTLSEEYKSWEYLYKKTFSFSACAEEKFSWGHAKLLLKIDDGKITDAKLYTDSMDWTVSDTVCNALKNCKFTQEDICNALKLKLQSPVLEDISALIKQVL